MVGRRTHELSDMEMTRGASNDDLLTDPFDPLGVGEDIP